MRNPLFFSKNPIKHKRLIKYRDYSNYENKSIMLLEKLGIAAFEYIELIELMIDELNSKIKNKFNTNSYIKSAYKDEPILVGNYKFSISKNITKQFEDIKNFNIIIEIKDIIGKIDKNNFDIIPDSEYYMLDEDDYDYKTQEIKNAKILIRCYSINQKIIEKDFYDTFIHEYNHLEEDKNRLLNHKELLKHYSKRTFASDINSMKSNNKLNRLLSRIEYMLWDKSEFNSWTTSAYSYLKGIKSKRENFHKDIKACEAYKHYKFIKDNIDKLYEFNNIDSWLIVYRILNRKQLNYNDKDFNEKLNNAKNKFIIKSKFLLNSFWKRLCRNASLYYLESERN